MYRHQYVFRERAGPRSRDRREDYHGMYEEFGRRRDGPHERHRHHEHHGHHGGQYEYYSYREHPGIREHHRHHDHLGQQHQQSDGYHHYRHRHHRHHHRHYHHRHHHNHGHGAHQGERRHAYGSDNNVFGLGHDPGDAHRTYRSHRYNARRASEEYEQARARARRFEERYTRQSFSVPRYGFAGRGPHGSHAFDPRSNYHGFAGGHNSRFPEDEFAAADPIHGMGSRHRHGGRHNHRHHEANVPPYANTRHDPLWGSDEDEPSLFDDPADDEPDFSDFEYNGFQGDQSEDDDRPNQGAHGFRGRNAFGEESGWGRHEPASPDQGGDGRTHYDVLGVPRDVEQAT